MSFRIGDKVTLNGWGEPEFLIVCFASEDFDWFRTEVKTGYVDKIRRYSEGWKIKKD